MNPSTDVTAPPRAERAALSRQLGDFLIEFSIALHRHAMYPDGHPSLQPACLRVGNRLTELLADRSSISLGVARSRLVIEGVATDSRNPVLKDLASRLHRHQLGAVTFRRGVTLDELREFLNTVAVDPERSGEPLGPSCETSPPSWFNIRVHPLSYDRLQFSDETGEIQARISRAEQLWIGMAQAALASADTAIEEDQAAAAEPSVVARAIDEHQRGSAYDQVIVGYMLQLAEELRMSEGQEALSLRRRMSQLIAGLDRKTLGTLLAMGGDQVQNRQFVLDASHTLAIDAVIDLVHAATEEAHGQVASQSLLRMLQKLARYAESGNDRRRTEADLAIREQVSELIRHWTLSDPNPDAYREALQTMAAVEPLFAVSPDQRFQVEPRRIVQMALEADAPGELVTRAVHRLLDEGDLAWLLSTLDEAEGSSLRPTDALRAIEELVASADTLERLLIADRLDVEALDRILPRMGQAAANNMIEALAEADSGRTRRLLLDRLGQIGPEVGPLAMARLSDPRWFVQRNMLVILGSLRERPEGFHPADFIHNRDPRVRREALRIMMIDPDTRERAVCHALADEDPRTVRLGLNAALEHCPDAALSLIVARTSPETPEDLRVLAIRALGNSRQRSALETLLELARPRRGFFRTRRPKSPEYLAALEALHRFADHPGAQKALAAAARSPDPDIVRAASVSPGNGA